MTSSILFNLLISYHESFYIEFSIQTIQVNFLFCILFVLAIIHIIYFNSLLQASIVKTNIFTVFWGVEYYILKNFNRNKGMSNIMSSVGFSN